MPSKENSLFLEIDLKIVEYTCGLFNFDWELLRLVLSAEAIYLVTMTQMQKNY